jgi:hypothetical protein
MFRAGAFARGHQGTDTFTLKHVASGAPAALGLGSEVSKVLIP